MFICSSFCVSNTCTLIGTFCRFSTRFCAVTTTSCRPPPASPVAVAGATSCAYATGTAASSVAATGTVFRTSMRGVTLCSRASFRLRLRVIGDPLAVIRCGNDAAPPSSKRNSSEPIFKEGFCRADLSRHGRYRGINLEHPAERLLQWSEVGLVVSPMFKGVAEDRLTDLLGAGGTHGALVLVEAQAAAFKRQAAVLKQRAHLHLGVGDHRFVIHTVHAAGEHVRKVLHQRGVITVVAADVLERVGEILSTGEVLLEAREATAERVAPGIDDACVRQDQLNESDIKPVVRHLVDEERRTALAVRASALEVALAELAQARGWERREGCQELGISATLADDLARDERQIRQLHGALDLRVAGEYLLDERRAGARQADHEDRVRIRRAASGALSKELRREQLSCAAYVPRILVRIVGMYLPPQAVALLVATERFAVLAAVLERLAECELEMQPVIIAQIGAFERLAQGGEVGCGELERLEIGETPPRLTERCLETDRTAIGSDAVFAAAGGLERVAIAHPHLGLLRKLLKDRLVYADRLMVVTETSENGGVQIAVARMPRLLEQQLLDLRQRQIGLALPVEHHRIVVAGGVKARCQLQTALEKLLGIRVAAQPSGHLRPHAQRRDIGRMCLQMRDEQRIRLRQIILHQRMSGLRQAGVAAGGRQVAGARLVGSGAVSQCVELVGKQTPGIGRVRLEQQRAPQGGHGFGGARRLAERHGELELHGERARLSAGERLEDFKCRAGLPGNAPGGAENQLRVRMSRHGLEYLSRLLCRPPRIPLQQPRGVHEGNLQGALGLRSFAQSPARCVILPMCLRS